MRSPTKILLEHPVWEFIGNGLTLSSHKSMNEEKLPLPVLIEELIARGASVWFRCTSYSGSRPCRLASQYRGCLQDLVTKYFWPQHPIDHRSKAEHTRSMIEHIEGLPCSTRNRHTADAQGLII